MAAKKVGVLIKEARTAAGLSQEALAKKIDGVSASDISKVERGEKDLTQAQLKEIAKVCGVTQKSLLDAPKNISSSSKKKTSTTSSAKKTSSSGTSMKLTATEKKLVELYREASTDTKQAAMNVLKGEATVSGDILSSLLNNAVDLLGKNGKK